MISPVMPNYARADLAFEKGEGAYLYGADGKRYLDFGAGIAVTSLGHCHPHLIEALTRQAGALWHCSNLYQIPEQTRLAATARIPPGSTSTLPLIMPPRSVNLPPGSTFTLPVAVLSVKVHRPTTMRLSTVTPVRLGGQNVSWA